MSLSVARKPQRIRIPDQFMRRIDTPPPSPPRPGPRYVSTSSNLASIKERMQPAGPGRLSPYLSPRSGARRTRTPPLPPQDLVIPPPHAFLVSKDVTQEVVRLQEESLNELRQVLSSYSDRDTPDKPDSPAEDPQDPQETTSEEYLAKKRPSFASKRMEAMKLSESLEEARPSQAWRRPVPSVPSKSPLAREAPFSFLQEREAELPADTTQSLVAPCPDPEVVKGEDPAEEAKQDRVQLAVDWVGGELQKLVQEILRLGHIVPGGQTQVEFGCLFAETANMFDALTGILKTAKKLGILWYEGEVLFQGVNDRSLITLLKEDIGEIKKETFIRTPPASPRMSRAEGSSPPGKHRKFGSGTQQYGHNLCAVCGKQVYQVEFVGATDKAFHRWCFKCCVCQSTLSPTNFATIADKYYCTVHYERGYLSSGGYRELEGGDTSLPT